MLRMSSVSMLGLCALALLSPVGAASHGLRSGGALEVESKAAAQVGLKVVDTDFMATRPHPLVSINIDKKTNEKAKSAYSGGVSSLMVVANLREKSFHALPVVDSAKLEHDELIVAWAHYNNTVKQNGWSYLSVGATKDARVSTDIKTYAAGFLEGLVSAQQIRDFHHNAKILMAKDEEKHHALSNIQNLFSKETHTVMAKSGMKVGDTLMDSNVPSDPWWRQARYALLQTWGMLDAYNLQVDSVKGSPMSMVDLLVLNSDGETPELETAFDMEESLLRQSQHDDPNYNPDDDKEAFLQKRVRHSQQRGPTLSMQRARVQRQELRKQAIKNLDDKTWRHIKDATGRCSALVRLTKDNRDLMVGHTTFSDYSEMTRVFKYYDLPLGEGVVQKMGFSSYPGVAGSTDDYYIMDSGLVVTETTISLLTDEPFDKLDDSGNSTVPDFMRIMIANRLARTGEDWVNFMKKSATGTYDSQWMVVDYNLFKPGQPLKNGTLWVIEQVPGISHMQDVTSKLQSQGFWASENRAEFKDVRDAIGASEAEELHGDLFSADKNPRAHIFTATAPKVQTLNDMRHELQRNYYPHEVDGGTGNTPDHAIAARGDLDKENPDPNGGVDSKVTNFCLAKRLQCNAISGPTHDTQKPFKWTDAKGKDLFPGAPHDGLPDLWNFGWVRMTPDGEAGALEDDCSA